MPRAEVRRVRLEDVASWMPPFSRGGGNGSALLIGGGWIEHGAPALAAAAAARAGLDEVYVAVPEKLACAVRCQSPDFDVVPLPDYKLTKGAASRLLKLVDRVNSILIGAGIQLGDPEVALTLAREAGGRGAALILGPEAARAEVLRAMRGLRYAAIYDSRALGSELGIGSPGSPEEAADALSRRAEELGGALMLLWRFDVASDGRVAYVSEAGFHAGSSKFAALVEGLAAGLAARGLDPLRSAAGAAFAVGMAAESLARRMGLHAGAWDVAGELPAILMRFDSLRGA